MKTAEKAAKGKNKDPNVPRAFLKPAVPAKKYGKKVLARDILGHTEAPTSPAKAAKRKNLARSADESNAAEPSKKKKKIPTAVKNPNLKRKQHAVSDDEEEEYDEVDENGALIPKVKFDRKYDPEMVLHSEGLGGQKIPPTSKFYNYYNRNPLLTKKNNFRMGYCSAH